MAKFHYLISFTSWDIEQFYSAFVCFSGFDVMNFEINLIFLIKPMFYMNKKLRQKIKYLENEKSS